MNKPFFHSSKFSAYFKMHSFFSLLAIVIKVQCPGRRRLCTFDLGIKSKIKLLIKTLMSLLYTSIDIKSTFNNFYNRIDTKSIK